MKFPSIKIAGIANELTCTRGIYDACNGKSQSAYGYKWEYDI